MSRVSPECVPPIIGRGVAASRVSRVSRVSALLDAGHGKIRNGEIRNGEIRNGKIRNGTDWNKNSRLWELTIHGSIWTGNTRS